ncbi:MAG TPA: arylesterase [Zeimonas sp.]|nr:arylesterase [Zeimonas sp.]
MTDRSSLAGRRRPDPSLHTLAAPGDRQSREQAPSRQRRALLCIAGALATGASLPGLGLAASSAPAAATGARTLLVLGDSLSAEYGLRRGSGWVEMLARKLSARRPPWRVVNASISGETTAGGRSRIAALLAQHRPAVVLIELGGNDALRGLALAATEENLAVMARQSRESGARVLLLGMQVPPNYGRAYTDAFAALFRSVAEREKAALLPFFLDGVAEHPELFQPDRIHPNEAAQSRMLENVWPALRPLLG